MELSIERELQGEILSVTAKGSVKYDAVLRLLKEVCEEAAEHRVCKILVNGLAVEGSLASFERYRLGTELAQYLTQRRIKIRLALIGVPPTVNGFAVRIARNRGIDAGAFPNHEEAQNWINHSPPADPEPEPDLACLTESTPTGRPDFSK